MWVTLFRSQILTTLSSLISCNPLCRLLCYKLRYAIIVHRTFIHDRSAPHVHVVISHYEQNGHLKTEIIIQSSLVSASKRVQLSLSKYVIFRTVEKCLKNVTKHRSDIRIICRQRVRIRGRATHWWTPRSLERWWVHFLRRQETESEQTVINKSSDREGALLKYDGNEVLWNHRSTHLVWRCGGYSSWCRYQTGCTRMQTWMIPEQRANTTSEIHLQHPFFFF